jgi:2Fe-2S ferredoxin
MPKITYRRPDGSAVTHDLPAGVSVMRGAVLNRVDGIAAECGGAASCGTCHVYVDLLFRPVLPAMDALEDDVLFSVASPRRDTSRLSCQLLVTPEMDGLIVELPDTQV